MKRSQNLILMLLLMTLIACGKSPETARKELGQMNIDYTEESFKTYVERGDKVVVDLFLTAGMNPMPILTDFGSDMREEIVNLLLSRVADVNAKDENGWTALMSVSMWGNPTIVKLLIKKGADVNAKTKKGRTPLIWAVNGITSAVRGNSANSAIVKLLLENGADVNAKDDSGMMSLFYAVKGKRNPDIVKLLLENGADVNAKERGRGTTVLMQAVDEGHLETIKILLEKGADMSIKDNEGHSVFDYTHDPKVLEMLNNTSQKKG